MHIVVLHFVHWLNRGRDKRWFKAICCPFWHTQSFSWWQWFTFRERRCWQRQRNFLSYETSRELFHPAFATLNKSLKPNWPGKWTLSCTPVWWEIAWNNRKPLLERIDFFIRTLTWRNWGGRVYDSLRSLSSEGDQNVLACGELSRQLSLYTINGFIADNRSRQTAVFTWWWLYNKTKETLFRLRRIWMPEIKCHCNTANSFWKQFTQSQKFDCFMAVAKKSQSVIGGHPLWTENTCKKFHQNLSKICENTSFWRITMAAWPNQAAVAWLKGQLLGLGPVLKGSVHFFCSPPHRPVPSSLFDLSR